MSTETPETDAILKYCKGIPEKEAFPYVAGHARSLERRNSELTAELEDLRQFKKEVDGEGVVPATRVLDKERQVSELTARIAELEANQDRLKSGLRWIRDNAEPDGAKRARIVLESEEAK